MRNRCISIALMLSLCMATGLFAFTSDAELRTARKLSPMLRMLVEKNEVERRASKHIYNKVAERRVCALVKTIKDGETALAENGCRVITHIGDIVVADVPLRSLPTLAADSRVCRIEAERGNELQLDSTARLTNVETIRTSTALPKAFTGKGVVMGVMDVGFDLTHPTFRDASGVHTRIKRFWDQLSTDTIGSNLYVGADYTTEADIMSYAHSRDGYTIFHGTHTLGIAAGNGAGTPFVGMAPESEICIVSNAVANDLEYIDERDLYRYTTATDLLGFKYIFDYAQSQGKPCVISFSEGSMQDFFGDDQLYYEALRELTGEGRILVASAGNIGGERNYVYKPENRPSAGTFMQSNDDYVRALAKSRNANYTLRTIIYDAGRREELLRQPQQVIASPDSTLSDTVRIGNEVYVQTLTAYNSCYNSAELVLDITVQGPNGVGNNPQLSFEMVGEGAEVEMYRVYGSMVNRNANPAICDGDNTHSILSPGSAPGVICVGSTNGRRAFQNTSGTTIVNDFGAALQCSSFSSVGPTFDGRAKPDVMAPGQNVVSACSRFYLERNPYYTSNTVLETPFEGCVYPWTAECGTSMSTPVVGGVVALWLEANPRLTPEDVLGVMARTSTPCGDYGSSTPNYCGLGAVDAYAGLLDVIGFSGIDAISKHNPQLNVSVKSDRLCIDFAAPMPHDWRLRIYSADGRLCHSETLSGGNIRYHVGLSALKRGVYAVQIDTENAETTGSVLIRI